MYPQLRYFTCHATKLKSLHTYMTEDFMMMPSIIFTIPSAHQVTTYPISYFAISFLMLIYIVYCVFTCTPSPISPWASQMLELLVLPRNMCDQYVEQWRLGVRIISSCKDSQEPRGPISQSVFKCLFPSLYLAALPSHSHILCVNYKFSHYCVKRVFNATPWSIQCVNSLGCLICLHPSDEVSVDTNFVSFLKK